jgi:DinB superfamily
MPPSLAQRQLIDRIRTAGEAVRQAVARIPPARHAAPPREGEWSALETLIHLRNAVVMVHGLRIRRLFYETDPVFADYDEAAHRQTSLAEGEAVPALVDTIVAEHQQVARLLDTLPAAAWARQGRHLELGPMSIEWLAQRAAEHGEEHAAQLADIARRV